jgi:branched-chain amino acid transport system substrate-binding protein
MMQPYGLHAGTGEVEMVRGRWLVAAVAALSAVVACQGGSSGSAPPVQIGVVAPFTGPDAQFGKLLSAPCIVAAKLIAQAGGIMGASASCVSIDDTGDPADAVPNVTRALATNSNLRMVVGLESQTAATTIPLIEKAKIPFFTANGLDAFDRTTDRFFWRMTAPDSANGVAFAL